MTVSLDINRKDNASTVSISGDMGIYDATELKSLLFDELGEVNEMELNLSNVEEMDTAGLQLLLLLKRESVAGNKVLKLVAHSRAVHEVIDLLRLGSYFGDPLVITAQ